MSDTGGGGGEPAAAGQPFFGTGVGVNLPALNTAAQQIGAVKDALAGLKEALRDLGANSYNLSSGVNRMFSSIADQARQTASAVNSVSSALGGVGGGGGTGTGGTTTGGGGGGWQQRALSSISNMATPSGTQGLAANFGMGGGGGGGGGGGNMVNNAVLGVVGGLIGAIPEIGPGLGQAATAVLAPLMQAFDMLSMFPLRYMRDQISNNRQTVYSSGAQLSQRAFASNVPMSSVMKELSKLPGDVKGNIPDLLDLFQSSAGYGAFYDFSGGGQNGPRTAGFLSGVRQAQILSPGTPVGQLAATIGGQASNVGAQQQAQMLTGGAMGMIKAGGGQKSLGEWAEGVLKWFEGMRGGSNRGKPFAYGELLAQYFPGSNIDAWFQATGVTQDMREMWWTYALNKTKTGTRSDMTIGPRDDDPLWNRLKATTEITTSQMSLGAKMSGAYANREQANAWFNKMQGGFNNAIIPKAANGPLSFVQYMPDSMEQLMMAGLENTGVFGNMIGGSLGWGSMGLAAAQSILGSAGHMIAGAAGSTLGNFLGGMIPGAAQAGSVLDRILPGHGFNPFDDVEGWPMGDVGGIYTTTGGKGTAGMHPDMQRKLGAMLRANPNIRVNSGLRDTHMQKTMRKRGIGTSGGPSAHTRGMAADLGPPSQYSWIVKNASKFGLSSGAHAGEPWHVGMGDLPDIGTGTIGNLFDLFKNFANIMGGGAKEVGSAAGGLMSFISSLLGFSPSDSTTPGADTVFNANVMAQLTAGGQNQAGIFSGGANSGAFNLFNGTDVSTSTSGAITGADGSAVGLPAGGGEGTQAAGIRAATALYNAGFRTRDDLTKITAISWRESRWNPNARNPNTSDRGLMQINMSANRALMQSMGYDEQDLYDIQKNANIAHRLYESAGGWWPWGYTPGVGWDRHGDPLGGTSGSHASDIVTAANIPGLGDVDGYMPQGSYRAGDTMHFANTFIIGGAGGAGGGIDARRTAQMIANHLEDEMHKRLARTS